jgi:hypothetical protein
LKIRRDAVAVSCILFTIALLMLTPAMCRDAATIPESFIRGELTAVIWPRNCLAFAGITSLAVILIGLIVTWAGYVKGVRWTWPIMFVIAWVWEFPALILPYLRPWKGEATNAQLFASTISQAGREWSIVEASLALLLMVVALILPVKTFFARRPRERG